MLTALEGLDIVSSSRMGKLQHLISKL
jgi:hypothetical protein